MTAWVLVSISILGSLVSLGVSLRAYGKGAVSWSTVRRQIALGMSIFLLGVGTVAGLTIPAGQIRTLTAIVLAGGAILFLGLGVAFTIGDRRRV